MTPRLTREGYAQLILALDGSGIEFTKIVLGNGDCPNEYTMQKNLVNPLEEVAIETLTFEMEKYATLSGLFSNTSTETSFMWTEVGIFCKNPNSTEEHPLDDILYAYGHYQMDAQSEMGAAVIPKKGTEIFEIQLRYRIYVGEITNITASLSSSAVYATKGELQEHIDQSNPHGTTAEDVGLGNVDNVSTNNQTVTYAVAGTTANLVSGETASSAFGKIAKAISDLIAHIGNATIHITAAERTAWNGKAAGTHAHSTADITSGTLGVARGGIGVTSLATLWTSLWSTRHGYLDNGRYIYGKDSGGTNRRLVGINGSNETFFGPDAATGFTGKLTHLHSAGGFCIRADAGTTVSGTALYYYLNIGTGGGVYPSSNISGYDTKKQNFGTSGHRWKTLYGVSTNMSSDKKLKDKMGGLEEAKDIIMGLEPIMYAWKDDPEQRPRYGFFAQDTYALMKKLGIENSEFYSASFVEKHGEHGHYDVILENLTDKEIEKHDDAELEWGLDYQQLIAPMVKVMQEQEKRIEQLEKLLKNK